MKRQTLTVGIPPPSKRRCQETLQLGSSEAQKSAKEIVNSTSLSPEDVYLARLSASKKIFSIPDGKSVAIPDCNEYGQ